ncbi:hypothetical protein GC093_10945 [Paenibacillus sp. LMG 31456]|uniref:SLH domain-containing protein n=1 Tax=Paenibacillus foliorum TaxID=2654974 RepID=A0A972GVU4_9BACL|nr:S-layer homology domain-containing protein [Paenibacillus foliorum]NOU93735.1 hypothetical protein [Paenibacillus foliorum]
MTHKWLRYTMSVCLGMALLLPQTTWAAAEPTFSLSTGSTSTVMVQDSFQVQINADQLDDVFSYELNVYYDTSLLEVDTTQKFTDLTGYALPIKIIEDGGSHVQLVYTKTGSLTGINGSATLGNLTFKAKSAGIAELMLKEAKTSTSSLKEETLLKPNTKLNVTVAKHNNNNGSKPSVSTGGSTGGDAAQGNTDSSNAVTIKSEQIVTNGSGSVVISIPSAAKQLRLPLNTADLLAGHKLEVQSNQIKLAIPAEVFQQLTRLVDEQGRNTSTIVLNIEPRDTGIEAKVLNQSQLQLGADVKLGGAIYDVTLSITTNEGRTFVLSQFDKPISLHMKVAPSINAKLSSIYYIPDNGQLERVGGEYRDGEIVADIEHFSNYVVLEVSKTFSDVPATHWAAEVIRELASKQIVSGTGENVFAPERNVSRAEFTALITRALNLKDATPSTFEDVQSSDWFASEVSKAVKAGLINGRSEGRFDPTASVTREEMTSIVMRAYAQHAGNPASTEAPTFSDEASIADWAAGDVKQAAALGLIQGRSTDTFAPQGLTTRAEAAQVLYRLLSK